MTDVKTVPADGIDLSAAEREAIDHFHQLRTDATHYELLGIADDADRKAVRDAYFALSKRFHPDVYFKRELGPYRERIDGLFRALTRAYDVLGNPKQRAAYDLLLKSEGVVSVAPKPMPFAGPPPKATPPAGLREAAQQARAIAASHASSGSISTAPTQVAPPVQRQSFPDGVVVPPSLRTVVEASSARPSPATGSSPPGGGVIDEATRARALEAMARRLGAAVRKPATSSASSPPAHTTAQQIADDRASKVAALVARGEEAQKKNDLPAALEAFKGAAQIGKEDDSLKARIDAVSQLLKMQQVSEHIEQAKEATRNRKHEEAATHWEKAWEGRRDDTALLLNAAEILSKAKENKRAAELAQRVIAIDPRQVRAHLTLATVFIDAGLRASARSAVENLARLEPNHPQLKELREKLGPLSIVEQFGLRGSR